MDLLLARYAKSPHEDRIMALESGTYISQLNSSNPTTSDDVAEGDDHLRLIKAVLKNQFSGLTGTTAISSSEAELNILDGVTCYLAAELELSGCYYVRNFSGF